MCTIETLSMHSSSFLELVEELSQSHPLFIPRVIAKLQAVQTKTPSMPPIQPSTVQRIVVKATEKEFAVEEAIKRKLEKIKQSHSEVNHIHRSFVKVTENLSSVEQQIHSKCDRLSDQAQQTKVAMLDQLAAVRVEHADDLQQKMDFLQLLVRDFEQETLYETSQLERVQKLLAEVDIDRKQRKKCILEIGKEAAPRLNLNQIRFEEALAMGSEVKDIRSVSIHEQSYRKIIRHFERFGKLKLSKKSKRVKSERDRKDPKHLDVDEVSDGQRSEDGIARMKLLLEGKENELRELKDNIDTLQAQMKERDDEFEQELQSKNEEISQLNDNCQRLQIELEQERQVNDPMIEEDISPPRNSQIDRRSTKNELVEKERKENALLRITKLRRSVQKRKSTLLRGRGPSSRLCSIPQIAGATLWSGSATRRRTQSQLLPSEYQALQEKR